MRNMGYCRFQNTHADLKDCQYWLADHEPGRDLSGDEMKAFERLIKVCVDLAENYGTEP